LRRRCLLDLLAGELAGLDRVEALDALGGVAVGDRLDFERVQLAEIGNLVERQRGVLHQPYGGGLGHQRLSRHGTISGAFFRNFPIIPWTSPALAGRSSCHPG
jgi:hypothetical protein